MQAVDQCCRNRYYNIKSERQIYGSHFELMQIQIIVVQVQPIGHIMQLLEAAPNP